MSDTTATTRAEILEEEKRKIWEQIEQLELRRASLAPGYGNEIADKAWELIDKKIDALLVELDNLCLDVPNGWVEEAAEARADAQPEVYDFTPFPKDMPDIKFETIDPIPF